MFFARLGLEEVASYFGKIATTCTDPVRIEIPSPATLRLASLAQCRHRAARRSVLSVFRVCRGRSRRARFMWYVYILKCEDGSLYTGFTDNPKRRFAEHKTKRGAKYTRSHKPKELLYTESFKNKSDALKRERQIKGWRRKKKLILINS